MTIPIFRKCVRYWLRSAKLIYDILGTMMDALLTTVDVTSGYNDIYSTTTDEPGLPTTSQIVDGLCLRVAVNLTPSPMLQGRNASVILWVNILYWSETYLHC